MVVQRVHETRAKTPRRHTLIVILAVWLVHGWSLGGGYVWDDGYNVGDNESIRSLSNVPGFFQNPWASSAPLDSHARRKNRGLYRPLTQTTYALDYAIFGDRAFGFHGTNVFIHCIAALLLLGLARRFLSSTVSLWCTLVWAIHPVHTETIALLSYRTSLLAACFGLAAMATRLRAERPLPGIFLRSLLFTAAVFSKEDGLVFVALIPLFDLWVEKIPIRRTIQNALPLLVIAVLYLTVRSQVIEAGLATHFFRDTSVVQRSSTLLSIFWMYAALIIVPFPLTPFYDWSILGAPGWSSISVWLGLTTLVSLLVLIVRFPRRRTSAFLAVCVLVALLPYAHFIPFTVGAAERFLYVPSIFAIILIARSVSQAKIQEAMSRGLRRSLTALFFAWIVVASAWTAYRHSQWWSQRAITEATVDAYPQSFNAWQAVARARALDGDVGRAQEAYLRIQKHFPCSLSIWPTLDEIDLLSNHKILEQARESLSDYERKCGHDLKDSSIPEIRDAHRDFRAKTRRILGPPTPD